MASVVPHLDRSNVAQMKLMVVSLVLTLGNSFLVDVPSLSPAQTTISSAQRTRASNDDFASFSSDEGSSGGNSDAMFLQSLKQRAAELQQKTQTLSNKWKTGDCKSSIALVLPDWVRRLDVDYPLVACGSSRETIYVGHLETGKICFQSTVDDSGKENENDDDTITNEIRPLVLQQTLRSMFGNFDGGGTLSIAFSGSLICEGGRSGGVRLWRIDPDSQQLVSQGSIPAMKGLLATCLHLDESGEHLWVGTHTGEIHSYALDNPLKPLALQTQPNQVWCLGGNNDHSCVLSLDLCPELNCGVASMAGGSVKLFSTSTAVKSKSPQPPIAALFPPFDSTERRSANIYPSQAAFVQTHESSSGERGLSIVIGGSDGSMYLQKLAMIGEDEVDLDVARPFQEPIQGIGQGHIGGGLIKAMLSPAVNLLITLGQDGSLRVWDVLNKSPFYHFAGYKVWGGSLWSDGRRIVSDGVDNSILMHDFAESEDEFTGDI